MYTLTLKRALTKQLDHLSSMLTKISTFKLFRLSFVGLLLVWQEQSSPWKGLRMSWQELDEEVQLGACLK